jgi:hypothetical protein
VFPTSGCNPKLDFLDCLKAVAERADLDKSSFWLHKFRATFATRCLWAGIDLRTVQQWLGHSDMESTMRYLTREVKRSEIRLMRFSDNGRGGAVHGCWGTLDRHPGGISRQCGRAQDSGTDGNQGVTEYRSGRFVNLINL